ncbi:hypothetical protein [Thioalbus denitrificans]|uniref:Uncharacterized protein n=1 Tax=Thioalbus denitrificans TaxID=547122 RepID=A0A369CKU8_9GAMM|nr:hypothetical protein [Thioalbus denitrificans]RCX33296.1 hypothetical protein DFQ59_101597 [Thioalbus denitrificans]
MEQKQVQTIPNKTARSDLASLMLGAGFAFASLIIIPALSQRLGMGASLTSAMRVALMRASSKA